MEQRLFEAQEDSKAAEGQARAWFEQSEQLEDKNRQLELEIKMLREENIGLRMETLRIQQRSQFVLDELMETKQLLNEVLDKKRFFPGRPRKKAKKEEQE